MLSKMLRASVNNTTNPTNSDANFKQVSLLLHGDGTNGAQNNTFLDSSTNNFTVTRNGNTTQGTNTPFSQSAGYWSNYFNGYPYSIGGAAQYIETPASANFTLNADFTIDMWINNGSGNSLQNMFVLGEYTDGIMIRITTGDSIYINGGFGYVNNLYQYANTGQWMHLAFSRTGSTLKIFVNGTQNYTGTFTSTLNSTGASVRVGAGKSNGGAFTGYVSNLRIIKGTGLYSSNFTPSTTPLTAVTNTQLLTCQSNYFKDNSSNNFTLTVTGTPSVQPFSPFAPTSAYSTSVNGGSMYFDGTTNALTLPSSSAYSFGTGDYTIEGWINLTSATQYYPIMFGIGTANNSVSQVISITFGDSGNLYRIGLGLNGIITYFNNGITQANFLNTWNHIAVVRNSGTINLYVNGVSVYSVANSTNLSSSYQVYVGSWASFYFGGYISNLRVVNGTALYTTTFTPPTAPLTAITNTSLLLSGTNAGIYDNAIKNDLETVGSAQVSTSVVKYGTGSMKFNGTGDQLLIPFTPQYIYGTSNWTVEFWVNLTTLAAAGICFLNDFNNGGYGSIRIDVNADGSMYLLCGYASPGWINTSTTATGLITTGTWYHIAAVRNGSVFTLYINGTSQLTYTSAVALYNAGLRSSISNGTNGYIDDLRITNGVARYTANFTPPTQAFPNQ